MYKLLTPLVFCVLLSGCQNNVSYEVKALSDNQSPNLKSYFLYPLSKDKDINGLDFRNVAKYVQSSLSKKGYTRTDDPYNSDFVIGMDYMINNVNISYSKVNVPLYGAIGLNTQTSGNISSSTYGRNVNTNYFQTTRTTPENGIIGYSQETIENKNYVSYLILKAATLDNQQQLYPIWGVVAATQTDKLDNFEMIKSLANMSSQLANKNTGDVIPVVIPLNEVKQQIGE